MTLQRYGSFSYVLISFADKMIIVAFSHQYGSHNAADDADEGAAKNLTKSVLAQHHTAGHDTA